MHHLSKITKTISLEPVAVVRDITENKEALEQLEESEEKFSKAFYSNSAGMLITTDSKIIEVNEAYANITGYKT